MITFGIITVSDRAFRKEMADVSGPTLKRLICANGWRIVVEAVLPDEQAKLERELIRFTDDIRCDVILTSGGTGLTVRDVTPEATLSVLEKQVPGIVELLRRESMSYTKHAVLSRAVAGIRGKTLIVNLPGNPKSVEQSFHVLKAFLEHAVGLLRNAKEHIDHIG